MEFISFSDKNDQNQGLHPLLARQTSHDSLTEEVINKKEEISSPFIQQAKKTITPRCYTPGYGYYVLLDPPPSPAANLIALPTTHQNLPSHSPILETPDTCTLSSSSCPQYSPRSIEKKLPEASSQATSGKSEQAVKKSLSSDLRAHPASLPITNVQKNSFFSKTSSQNLPIRTHSTDISYHWLLSFMSSPAVGAIGKLCLITGMVLGLAILNYPLPGNVAIDLLWASISPLIAGSSLLLGQHYCRLFKPEPATHPLTTELVSEFSR